MGRPEFEKVVASAAREKLIYLDLSGAVNVAAGQTLINDVFAPAGYVGQVVGMYFSIAPVAGASSGTQSAYFGYPTISILRGDSLLSDWVTWYFSNWTAASSLKSPLETNTALMALQSIVFDDVTPFRINYANNTNLVQTANRSLKIVYKLKQVAK